MNKIKVSAVSYTNSLPFIFGLQNSAILEEIDLSLDVPSDCALKLIDKQVDIGLVPVAALLDIPNYQIVADYCIGANGAVNSVFIFSHKPIEEIKRLRLDNQSRTSNALARVLLKNFWKLEPNIVKDNEDAFVEIGDRTFGKKDKFPFVYDLAEEWKKFSGLPFSFAVWASNRSMSMEFVQKFNAALKLGLDNRFSVISNLPERSDIDLEDYLMNKIDYSLDSRKLEAVQKFLNLVKAL